MWVSAGTLMHNQSASNCGIRARHTPHVIFINVKILYYITQGGATNFRKAK